SGHDKFYGLPTEGHEGMRHVLTMMQDAGEPGLEHPGARIIERHIGTHPGGPEATILNMNRVHIVYSDDDGSLEVKHSDTGRQLTAKDKQGKVVFEGPIDSDTDRKAVPDAVRTRLDNLEHTDKLEYLPDEHFKAEPTPTAALEEGANVYYRKEGVGPSLPAI
ncbi:MAG TPA: hypothetical protein VKC60_01885, partial [Opitutaceae bacterium]|nr:hypothetical protein [Opitutaceae bacterium]